MPPRNVLRTIWGPATLVAALVGAALVAFLTFVFFGVVVMEPFLQWFAQPAAALLTGVGATLAASWTATLLAPLRTRTRLSRVLLWSEAAGMMGLVIFQVLTAAQFGPNSATRLAPLVLLVAGAAAFTAVRAQVPRAGLRRDALVSLGLLVLLPVGLYAVIALACAVEQCGA